MAGFSNTGSPAFGQWRSVQKERLLREAANVLARLGEEYGYQGNLTRAVDYYLRWISIDPFDEQANQQLMSLYVRSGQRAAALDHFDAFKRKLAQELGVDPPVAMLDLYTTIQAEAGESAAGPGRTVRGYELREHIATGGFGIVYKALQPSVGREVAVKIILPQYASDPTFMRRFEAEARLVAQLEHPAIVPLYDYWSDDSGAYLVMRWLRGGSLREALANGPWTFERIARLVGQLADGLSLAHARGIVHRDIKPANILLDEAGNAYISDFGFAKDMATGADLTLSGAIIGSPAYMSPEQIKGERVTPASDIYSLGVVLYELLVGQQPFGDQSPATLIYKNMNEPLPPVRAKRQEIPEAVEWVVQRATSKEPGGRYPDVVSFADDLRGAIFGEAPGDPVVIAGDKPLGASFLERADSFLGEEDRAPKARPVFVARQRELARLASSLDGAINGEGQIVFIAGEAGRGKTALLDEFAHRAQEKHPELIVAIGNCNAFSGIGDPYLPFRDILGLLTGDIESRWSAGLMTRQQARRLLNLMPHTLKALLDEGPDLIDVLVPGAALLKRFAPRIDDAGPDERRLRELVERQGAQTTDREQRQIFEECTKVFHCLSSQSPMLLAFDDLQWADGASVNLLFHLGRRLAGRRILVLGAYRPSEVVRGGSSVEPDLAHRALDPVLNEFKRIFGDIQIDLGRYPLVEGRAFVDALLDSEPNALSENFRSKLFWKTKGHALFTAELLGDMRERGDLLRDGDGKWIEGLSLDWEQLPARVEAVIDGRVSRLDEDLRDVLNVASVEGEEFTAEVVARVSGRDQRKVIRWLSSELDRQHRLVVAQGMKRLAGQRLSVYRFRHSLFQEFLYQNMDEVERSILHEEMGDELERLYDGQTEDIAPQLARHYLEAGIHEKAVDYLLQAGNKAIRLSAHSEAIDHLRRGLDLIHRLPEGLERDDKELALQIALGVPLQVTKGPGASEVGEAYSRARELYQVVGQPSQLYPAMWGLWRFYRSRADFQTARQLADELLTLTLEVGDPSLILQGHHAKWTTFIYLGEFEDALNHIEEGLALYSPQQHHSDASLFSGHDLGVCAHTMASYALWMLGYPDKALERAKDALRLSQEFNHPSSLALSYEHLAGIHRFRREPEAAEAMALELIRVAKDMGSEYDEATGQVLLGWALVEQGQGEEGLDQIRQGLAKRRPLGTGLEDAHMLAVLAEALGKVGQMDEALLLLEELYLTIEETDQRFWEAEVHRLKGDLLARQGISLDEAEKALQEAIAAAARQGAKSLELRAAIDLERLYQQQGREEENRDRLSPLVEWFTEGYETPDFREAKALLDKGIM
jgi:serine/threonine protein kinase/predicted ATPase